MPTSGELPKSHSRDIELVRVVPRGHGDKLHSLLRSLLTDTMALASFASVRIAPALAHPRASRAAPRRGLVIVAGKKGAWAKEFDPEFEKKNAPAEVDESKWPGLDSAYARISQTRSCWLSRRELAACS